MPIPVIISIAVAVILVVGYFYFRKSISKDTRVIGKWDKVYKAGEFDGYEGNQELSRAEETMSSLKPEEKEPPPLFFGNRKLKKKKKSPDNPFNSDEKKPGRIGMHTRH